MQLAQELSCYCCGSAELSTTFIYNEPPIGETRFSFSGSHYHREVLCCPACGHYLSIHDMDDSELYDQAYVDSTYGDRLRNTFDKIVSLDPTKSDNIGRCDRIVEYSKHHWPSGNTNHTRTILDIGSGLCVFLHRMKAEGWHGTALDPDPRACEHARAVVGVDAVCGNFLDVGALGRFDVITFNKVLEHVRDPASMLSRSKQFLDPNGFVYIEVPDGELASRHGPVREEFFVEHHHVFSSASLAMLASRAGYTAQIVERLQEPSAKYTLRAFLSLT